MSGTVVREWRFPRTQDLVALGHENVSALFLNSYLTTYCIFHKKKNNHKINIIYIKSENYRSIGRSF